MKITNASRAKAPSPEVRADYERRELREPTTHGATCPGARSCTVMPESGRENRAADAHHVRSSSPRRRATGEPRPLPGVAGSRRGGASVSLLVPFPLSFPTVPRELSEIIRCYDGVDPARGGETMEAGNEEAASTPAEGHERSGVRRRNVPLVQLPDSTRAWRGGVAPRMPDATAGKQRNGALAHEDGGPSSRERMKLSVIRGSVVNPDLTLGELRLLGCSSEGFVNGTLPPPVVVHYDQQGTSVALPSIWGRIRVALGHAEVSGLETGSFLRIIPRSL